MDKQAIFALGVVAITAVIFVVKCLRRNKGKGGCSHNCGCEKQRKD